MNEHLNAILLGIIQGITEFLPISSSGHLIVFSYFTKGETLSLSLNVALHMGTLLAILIYFRKDWTAIVSDSIHTVFTRDLRSDRARIPLAIFIGTVPAGLLGVLFKDDIERLFHKPVATVAPLIIVGILLYLVDRKRPSNRSVSNIGVKDGLIIGFAQALALIPGTSRSGITIIAGRSLSLSREESARFSFLLGAPVMLGAVILDIKNLISSMADPVFYLGFLTSFVVGYATIAILLKTLRKYGFAVYAVYRVCLGCVILLLLS